MTADTWMPAISRTDRSIAGALIFLGAAQFILVLVIAEALYPGYNMATNYISDVGVGQTALLFNASAAVFGALIFIGALFGRRAFGTALTISLAIAGVSVVGVGLFPETIGVSHFIFSAGSFVFGAVSAMLSYRIVRPPLSYCALSLGIVSLAALFLEGARHDLGLGVGGMERLIAYPLFIWALGFGGFLIGSQEPDLTPEEESADV